jgi:membrane-associated phospholipid phosphatase
MIALALALVVAVVAGASNAVLSAGETVESTRSSSVQSKSELALPTLGETLESHDANTGFSFAAFGDQKNLWSTREFSTLLSTVRSRRPLFVIDSGDIVDDGQRPEQFAELQSTLERDLAGISYLLAAGNHELHDDAGLDDTADSATGPRHRLFAFLPELRASLEPGSSGCGESASPARLYYCRDVGDKLRLLFADTNDLIAWPQRPERAKRQLEWLRLRLDEARTRTTVVVGHHPFLLSSKKHREDAELLWNLRDDEGRLFPDLLADFGADLVIAGHTHTYERFVLTRDDGSRIQVVNASGRPTGLFSGSRRARDISADPGWTRGFQDLETEGGRFGVAQPFFARRPANQFAWLDVSPTGAMKLSSYVVIPGEESGLLEPSVIDLLPAATAVSPGRASRVGWPEWTCSGPCPGRRANQALAPGPPSWLAPALGGLTGLGVGAVLGDRIEGGSKARSLRWEVDAPITAASIALLLAPRLLQHQEPGLCGGLIKNPPWPDRAWRGLMSHWPEARNRLDALSYGTLYASLLPVGAALGRESRSVTDVALPLEAALAALAVTSAVKHVVHRPRPYAWACEPPTAGGMDQHDNRLSFFSGHTSATFAAAFAAREMLRLEGAKGSAGTADTALGLAIATGLLRTAADRHYLTDVIAGAAVGWAVGKGIARLHKPETESAPMGAPSTKTRQPSVRLPLAWREGSSMTLGFGRGEIALGGTFSF